MIQTDLTTRARRIRGASWVVGLLAAVLTAGCSPAPAPPQAKPDVFRDTFVTSNGLLSVPELWKAVDRSVTAELLRHLALLAAGRPSTWQRSAHDTFKALSAESDPVVAAGLVLDAHLDPRGLWSGSELRTWWRSARAGGDIDHQAVLVRLADNPARLPVTTADLDAWRGLMAGPDIVPAQIAGDLLALFSASSADARPSSATINFRTPRDAAAYLLRAADGTRRSPDAQNPEILAIARGAIPTDDWSMYDLAMAYAVAGQPQAAGQVVDAMDARRLLPGGGVLEVPVFEGTVGSTFRMVRTLHAQGRLRAISPDLSRDLVHRTRSLLDRDVSHRIAGLALINLLEPGTVPAADAEAAVAAAVEQVGGSARLSSPRQAIGWTAIAEYGDALGIRVTFPGISARAVRTWVAAKEPLAAVSISRFLLAVGATSRPSSDQSFETLVSRVRTSLADPAAGESIALFSGTLAVHAATGRWPLPERVVREQRAAREGGCLGGFDGFVRDLPTAGAACDTDATWFATLLDKELDR